MQKKSIIIAFLIVFLGLASIILWLPSIFVLSLGIFVFPIKKEWKYVFFGFFGLVLFWIYSGYLIRSFFQGFGVNAIAEELPLVGLVFILHILHFYKSIPKELKYYGWFLLIIGAVKSKYMFLASFPLILGLIFREDIYPLTIRGKTFTAWFFVIFFAVGWLAMALFMYPTSMDIKEMSNAIKISQDNNVVLYNDWGDGWTFVSLGYDANYKAYPPEPDWNKLARPFVAYTIQDLNWCKKISTKTYEC